MAKMILWCLIEVGDHGQKRTWIHNNNLRRWINAHGPDHIKPIRWTRNPEWLRSTHW